MLVEKSLGSEEDKFILPLEFPRSLTHPPTHPTIYYNTPGSFQILVPPVFLPVFFDQPLIAPLIIQQRTNCSRSESKAFSPALRISSGFVFPIFFFHASLRLFFFFLDENALSQVELISECRGNGSWIGVS